MRPIGQFSHSMSVVFAAATLLACYPRASTAADNPDVSITLLPVWSNDATGVGKKVRVKIPNNQTADHWTKDLDCGSTHTTAQNSLRYGHFHVPSIDFTIGILARDADGTSLGWNVTTERINAYYDTKYNYPSATGANPQVDRTGGPDTTYNCYAYATGRTGQVIDDNTPGSTIIFNDDYSGAVAPFKVDDVGVSSSIAASFHAWKVTDVQQSNADDPTTAVIVQTKEKNQFSAIYTETYTLPTGLVPSSSEMVRKK